MFDDGETSSLRKFKKILSTFDRKAILGLILLGFTVFSNGLLNGFLGDDIPQLVKNVSVHSVKNMGDFFVGSTFYNGQGGGLSGVYYKPLMLVIFSVIYSVFGPGPFWFHLVQLLLHIANTAVLFFVFKHFFKNTTALALSIIFLIHPINSESVFYTSALQEPLFFLFGILALWVLINRHGPKSIIYATVLLFLSLLSKETGILFLATSILYVYFYRKKEYYKFLFYAIIASSLYFILKISAVGLAHNPHNSPIDELSLGARLLNVPRLIVQYLKTFVFPLELSWTSHWTIESIDFPNFFQPLAIVLVLAGVYCSHASYLYKKHKLLLFKKYIFFGFILFIGLLLHMQIIPLDLMASERWFYFPIFGLLGILGTTYELLPPRLCAKYFSIILIVIILLLSLRTISRGSDWKNEEKLYQADLKINENNYVALNNIGLFLLKQGRIDEARSYVERSINLYPTALNYNSSGLIFYEKGEYAQAKEAYYKGLEKGNFQIQYESVAQLGLVYGNPSENIKFIENALRKFPKNPRLWQFLAILYYRNGRIEEAKSAITIGFKIERSIPMARTYDVIMNEKELILGEPKNIQ